MDVTSADAERKYAALVAIAGRAVVALDFDGTLAPIVDDPARAPIHPDAGAVLIELAPKVRAIAVVTGRPARQVLALGGLEQIADALAGTGTPLLVFGQYGTERWTSADRSVTGPPPPAGLARLRRDLPAILRAADVADAYVEDKGLAVAVHTRRLADPRAAFDRLLAPLRSAAEEHGLVLEPGKQVIEVRSGGMDKGLVVDGLVETFAAEGVLFAGDDLGDVEAFEALDAWAAAGLATLKVCSASGDDAEPRALLPLADVVVDGPGGVLALLRRLAADA